MSEPLMLELQLHEHFHERILQIESDVDERTSADTLEGLTDLVEKLGATIRSQQEDHVIADALKVRIKEMQERYKRFGIRAARKRDLVCEVMQRANIPDPYWVPQPAKLDCSRISADLQNNIEIKDACLECVTF